jgi:hypothetical protein
MYPIRRIPVRAILLAALLAVSAAAFAAATAQAVPCEDCEETGEGGGGGDWGGGGGGGGSTAPLQLAQHIVTWSDFGHLGTGDTQCTLISPDQGLCGVDLDEDRTLLGGDHVLLGEQDGGPFGIGASEIEVVLRTAPSITWWKEIKAFTADGRALAWVETKGDNHGPVAFRVPIGGSAGATSLVLSRASGLLGWPTGAYQVLHLHQKAGKRLTFMWTVD